MNNKILNTVKLYALALSIIATILVMLYAAAWQIDSGGVLFILWGISPYIAVFLVDILLRKLLSPPRQPLIFCITAVLMLAFTLFVYGGIFGNESSTFALVFLFIPIYLFIGAFVLIVIGSLLGLLFKPSKPENS